MVMMNASVEALLEVQDSIRGVAEDFNTNRIFRPISVINRDRVEGVEKLLFVCSFLQILLLITVRKSMLLLLKSSFLLMGAGFIQIYKEIHRMNGKHPIFNKN